MSKRKQANRKMAGKKGQIVQLQIEVNTNEEWNELLTRKGLVVVDLYSDWCGPCAGMTGTLKKIKLDIGGDTLTFAIAKTDDIDALERFRNRSEPTWMFIASGHLVNVMFGANAPKLIKMIYEEMEKETLVLKGQANREFVAWDELTEEERVRHEEKEKKRLEALEKEKEKEAAALALAHHKEVKNLMKYISMYTVILIMPYLYDEEGNCDAWVKLMDALGNQGYQVYDDNKFKMDPELASQLLYGGTKKISQEFAAVLEEGLTMAKFMEYKLAQNEETSDQDQGSSQIAEEVTAAEEKEETIISQEDALIECVKTIYGYSPVEGGTEPKVHTHSFEAQFQMAPDIPAFWTPYTPFIKGSAILKLFPKWASQYALPPEPKLPLVITIVYNATRTSEVFDMMEEIPDAVVKYGYFSSPDRETATLITMNREQYEKRPEKEPQETLIIAVDRTRSDPVLSFCSLLPLYASANPEEGEEDYYAFFKEEEEEEEEEIIEETEDVIPFGEQTEGPIDEETATVAYSEGIQEEFVPTYDAATTASITTDIEKASITTQDTFFVPEEAEEAS